MKLNKINMAIVVPLVSLAFIVSAAAYTGVQVTGHEKPRPAPVHDSPNPQSSEISDSQDVAVKLAVASTYQAEVSGYGEAHAAHELTYTSEVSGRVLEISDDFVDGMIVSKGTVLARLDDTNYQQALTQAKADVAQAKLDLLEEQRQGEQAKLEWKRSGLKGKPDSPLVLRQPQLENAKATLANAELELKKAQRDVDNTIIRAPFDALVVSRNVEPGSYIQSGTEVASLYSIERVEIEVPLSKLQWSTLPQFDNDALKDKQWHVNVFSSDNSQRWQGYVARVQQHMSESTRQRSLVVAVDNPLGLQNHLYPGAFVQVTIPGASFGHLWELPSSAVSQQGNIWLVENDGLLKNSKASVRFAKNGNVYVDPVRNMTSAQVVKRPLSSFQTNMRVHPVREADDE